MPLSDDVLRAAIFGGRGAQRFTQDSPVLPDVWWTFGRQAGAPEAVDTAASPDARVTLLLTPHRRAGTLELVEAIRRQFGTGAADGASATAVLPADLAYNEAYVKGAFTFEDLVCRLLPLTRWYQEYLWRGEPPAAGRPPQLDRDSLEEALLRLPGSERDTDPVPADLVWLVRLAGSIALAQRDAVPLVPWAAGPLEARRAAARAIIDAFATLLARTVFPAHPQPLLWRVNRNRVGTLAVWRSRQTVKADAAERTFATDCSHLRWVVIDTGIDATHPAFRRRSPDGALLPAPAPQEAGGSLAERTRVVETYDFTRLAHVLKDAAAPSPTEDAQAKVVAELADAAARLQEVKTLADQPGAPEQLEVRRAELLRGLASGRMIPWDLLQPLLRVGDEAYEVPAGLGEHDHGTHVAGILAGDWRQDEQQPRGEHDLRGMCPTLELVDIRVMDQDGTCDEFTVITALQFVRFLNQRADQPVIHGVNISLQFAPDPASFAAGHTPICEECERLVGSGVVVVVAAGNSGFEYRYTAANPETPWFIDTCIADPGTTEGVITVGATHRDSPHTYGVSYFSSRGPTPDGRHKPDVLAPGEKIVAPVPHDGLMAKDGTSMAAPHVSGAAAMLMARHGEYIGRPAEIKRILMETATDLGRERNFQGAGLIDVLRALAAI